MVFLPFTKKDAERQMPPDVVVVALFSVIVVWAQQEVLEQSLVPFVHAVYVGAPLVWLTQVAEVKIPLCTRVGTLMARDLGKHWSVELMTVPVEVPFLAVKLAQQTSP